MHKLEYTYDEVWQTRYRIGVMSELESRQGRTRERWREWKPSTTECQGSCSQTVVAQTRQLELLVVSVLRFRLVAQQQLEILAVSTLRFTLVVLEERNDFIMKCALSASPRKFIFIFVFAKVNVPQKLHNCNLA